MFKFQWNDADDSDNLKAMTITLSFPMKELSLSMSVL